MAPKPPRLDSGRAIRKGWGRREPATPSSRSRQRPHPARSRPPHPPAGPRSGRAHVGGPRGAARFCRLPPRAGVTEHKSGSQRPQLPGRRTLTRADPTASVLARAAPFQALGRTSGLLARAAPRPRRGILRARRVRAAGGGAPAGHALAVTRLRRAGGGEGGGILLEE